MIQILCLPILPKRYNIVIGLQCKEDCAIKIIFFRQSFNQIFSSEKTQENNVALILPISSQWLLHCQLNLWNQHLSHETRQGFLKRFQELFFLKLSNTLGWLNNFSSMVKVLQNLSAGKVKKSTLHGFYPTTVAKKSLLLCWNYCKNVPQNPIRGVFPFYATSAIL